MTDLERMHHDRVHGIRNYIEYDYTETDDDALPEVIYIVRGDMTLVVIPTVADGMIAIDIGSYHDGVLVKSGDFIFSEATL
jgi:hypothetical protein